MADFFLIRDKKTQKYYDGRFRGFNRTVGTSEARFVKAVNANEEIKRMRTMGKDVSALEIVPCSVVAEQAIEPTLSELKKGYVIRIHRPDKDYPETVYWKGNRKTPDISYCGLFHQPKAPHTASNFKTLAEANEVYNKIKAGILELIKKEKKDIRERKSRDRWATHAPRGDYEVYLRAYESVEIQVVQVG